MNLGSVLRPGREFEVRGLIWVLCRTKDSCCGVKLWAEIRAWAWRGNSWTWTVYGSYQKWLMWVL